MLVPAYFHDLETSIADAEECWTSRRTLLVTVSLTCS